MSVSVSHRRRWAALAAALLLALGSAAALAQIPAPPSTIFGSVSDEAGPVAEHLPVQGYVGDKLCGTRGETQFTGEGSARVTVYYIDVLSTEQTPGCGKQDAVVRIKIGDRFAPQTARWQAGPVHVDITFGNVSPAAIPTFTPAPKPTADPNQPANNGTPLPQGNATIQPVGTIPPGTPGAGSPYPTRKGGVTSSAPSGSSGDGGGGGFPLWGVAILVLGGIAAVGGGVGFAMSRSSDDDDDLDDTHDYRPPSGD
jgi:hypothetical protein